MKTPNPDEKPKCCPRGHLHLSWSPAEDEVYCWDCDRKYLLSECGAPDPDKHPEEGEAEPHGQPTGSFPRTIRPRQE
jgi:hypothetical protein